MRICPWSALHVISRFILSYHQHLNNQAFLLPLLLASCLLGACATQTYEAKPIAPEQWAAQWRERNLQSQQLQTYLATQGAAEDRLPVKTWGLPELTLAAFFFHPDLDLARAQWRAAQAGNITAAQKPNPALSASGEHHGKASGISPWTYGIGIDIPFETHGKREARMEQAAALTEAARLDIAQSAWQIRARLRVRMLEVYAAQQQAAQLQREVDARAQIVALLETRMAAGMVGGTDLSDARLQLQKSRTALAAESARLTEARASLAAAVGLPDAALANVPLSFAAFERDNVELPAEDLQRAALLNRLEIRKALAGYDAAEAKLKLEIAKQYPDFSLAPGYSWDQGDNRWSLGLSLILALLNRNEGPIAEARALREVEAQRFNTLQAGIVGEQSQALARWAATQTGISKAQQQVAAQQARLGQTQRQFDVGYADRLELTSAQLELIAAEANVLAARLQTQRALGQLEDAVQQPLDGSAPLPETPQEAQP